MNNSEQQDEFLKELDFIRATVVLKIIHDDFLKTIKPDNRSEAIAILIEKYMKQTKMLVFERYILYFIFGVCIIILTSLLLPLL